MKKNHIMDKLEIEYNNMTDNSKYIHNMFAKAVTNMDSNLKAHTGMTGRDRKKVLLGLIKSIDDNNIQKIETNFFEDEIVIKIFKKVRIGVKL